MRKCLGVLVGIMGTVELDALHQKKLIRKDLKCRNLIKKPWAFIRVPYMNPISWVLEAQGFLIRFLHKSLQGLLKA